MSHSLNLTHYSRLHTHNDLGSIRRSYYNDVRERLDAVHLVEQRSDDTISDGATSPTTRSSECVDLILSIRSAEV